MKTHSQCVSGTAAVINSPCRTMFFLFSMLSCPCFRVRVPGNALSAFGYPMSSDCRLIRPAAAEGPAASREEGTWRPGSTCSMQAAMLGQGEMPCRAVLSCRKLPATSGNPFHPRTCRLSSNGVTMSVYQGDVLNAVIVR